MININDSRNEWDIFASLENFQLAWRRLRNSSRLEVKDRIGIDIYAADHDYLLELLLKKVTSPSGYRPDLATNYYMVKRDRTLRPITYLSMEDKLVFQALGNIVIKNAYSDVMRIADVTLFAHVPESVDKNGNFKDYVTKRAFAKGTTLVQGQYEKFKRRILALAKQYAKSPDSWLVFTDISSFYPSVDHYRLRQVLEKRRWLTDERLLSCLFDCLNTWTGQPVPHVYGRGLPIGYDVSDIIATLYLSDALEVIGADVPIYRYVDDMVVFTEGKDAARKVLINIDLQLQAAQLIRKGAKTEIIPCNATYYSAEETAREISRRLSFIDILSDGSLEDQEIAQEELEKMFEEVYQKAFENEFMCSTDDLKCLGDYERDFAFILYRYENRDERLKKLAQCILIEFPERSKNATTYLANFIGDQDVVDFLFRTMDESVYSEVKINCATALYKLLGQSAEIANSLINWIEGETDWYLRLESLDLLSKLSPNAEIYRNIALIEKQEYIASKALVLAFEANPTRERRIRLINYAFAQSWRLQLLGIYLWRRNADIRREELELSSLPQILDPLVLTLNEHNSLAIFLEKFEALWGFIPSPEFRFAQVFSDLTVATQQLIDATDSIDNPNRFITVLYPFVECITRAVVGISVKVAPQTSLSQMIEHFEGNQESVLNTLNSYVQIINQGEFIKPGKRKKLQDELSVTIALFMEKLHSSYGIELSKTHELYLQKIRGTESMPNPKSTNKRKIFVCYSHHEDEWLERIKEEAIKPFLFEEPDIDVWSDQRIAATSNWRNEISKAIDEAHVALLLISNRFLASDFIRNTELPKILQRASVSGLKIAWIAVRYSSVHNIKSLRSLVDIQSLSSNPVDWPLAKMQQEKPADVDTELTKIGNQLMSLIKIP